MKYFVVYKKPFPRSAINLAIVTTFNEAIAMNFDSHDKNIWYFQINNEFNKFSKAAIIKNRNF